MAYTITSESYGRRLPKITATADSTDDLATLSIDWAEGSSCVIGTKTYVLDKVSGWVESGSGSGSSDFFDLQINLWSDETKSSGYDFECDKTYAEIVAAIEAGKKLRPMLVERNDSRQPPLYYTQPLTYIITSQNEEIQELEFYTPAYVTGDTDVGMFNFLMNEDSRGDEANWCNYPPQITPKP